MERMFIHNEKCGILILCIVNRGREREKRPDGRRDVTGVPEHNGTPKKREKN